MYNLQLQKLIFKQSDMNSIYSFFYAVNLSSSKESMNLFILYWVYVVRIIAL